jgi:hypothetical protein
MNMKVKRVFRRVAIWFLLGVSRMLDSACTMLLDSACRDEAEREGK